MPVDVQFVTSIDSPSAGRIERWAGAALEAARAESDGESHGGHDRRLSKVRGELCVRVVDEEESCRLNRDYRHKASSTNVLSFPAGVRLPDAVVWGDVVVCAPVVQREAADQHKRYEDHFAHMIVHGVLHLLGYDHESAAEAAAMEELETRILDGFGVSDPYGEG